MIRVLHVGLSHQFGGIESFLLNLGRSIDRSRFRFDYVAYGPSVPREDEFAELGSTIYHLNNRRNPLAYARELLAIMESGYDIVHIHKNSAADVIPFMCARRAPGLKVVAHAHNTRSGAGCVASSLNTAGRYAVLRCSDALLACSAVAAHWLYGAAADRAMLIPNGIDISAYAFDPAVRERVRAELGIGDDIVVGCVGRFRAEKNQAFLVGVLKELLRREVSARIMFLGDGTELEPVKERFADEGLADRAHFFGSVRNVPDYMQAMDALAMPSLFEGLPLVAVEGQAAGLPVLLSDRITSEVCLTESAVRLPIGEGNEVVWTDAVLNEVLGNVRLEADVSGLALFDSRATARIVSEVYSDVVK